MNKKNNQRINRNFVFSDFTLEDKISLSSLFANPPLPGDTPLPPELPPIVPTGPVGPAQN